MLSLKLIAVSATLSILRQLNFVNTCFRIQSLYTLTSITFPNWCDNVTTIMWSDAKFVIFMINVHVNLTSNLNLVTTSPYSTENRIKVDICKCWTMKQVTKKFGSLKIDIGGDTTMGSNAVFYCNNFERHIYHRVQWIFTLDSHPTVFCTDKTNSKASEQCIFQVSQPVLLEPSFQIRIFIHVSQLLWQCLDDLCIELNVWYFFRILLHFNYHLLVIELQFFK